MESQMKLKTKQKIDKPTRRAYKGLKQRFPLLFIKEFFFCPMPRCPIIVNGTVIDFLLHLLDAHKSKMENIQRRASKTIRLKKRNLKAKWKATKGVHYRKRWGKLMEYQTASQIVEKIRELIKQERFTHTEIAQRLGVTPSRITYILSAKSNPTLASILLILDSIDYELKVGFVKRKAR